VAQRFGAGKNGNTVARGGARERAVSTVCSSLIQAGKDCEALFPDGTDKNNIMTALDSLAAYIHTAGGKITD
jgi:hypothetical protein